MKQSVRSVEQLRMLPGCVLLEEVDNTLQVPGIGEIGAEQIVEGKEGVLGVRGAFPSMEPRGSQKSVAGFRVRAVAPDLADKFGIGVGDEIVLNGMLKLFTPVQVGTEELLALYVEEGGILAAVEELEEEVPEEEGLAQLLSMPMIPPDEKGPF